MSNRVRHGLIVGALVLVTVGSAGIVAAGVVRSLTDATTSDFGAAAIDDSGSLIAVVSSADPFGANPDHAYRLLALTGPASGTQVPLPGLIAIESLSVSDDGTTIYFLSPDDLLGGNPDFGRELYSVETDGSNLTQLTNTPAGGGELTEAIVAGGGTTALLLATIDPLGSNAAQHKELFALVFGTGTYTQLTSAAGAAFDGFDISDNGTRIAFASNADLTGANADGSWEIYSVLSTGALLAQRTNGGSSDFFGDPVISGDGSWMACTSDGIYTKTFGGGGTFTQVALAGHDPSITDDGSTVIYTENVSGSPELVSIPTGGGVRTLITSTASLFETAPVVSGDGSTITFFSEDYPALKQLAIIDANGSNRDSLVTVTASRFQFGDTEPHLSSDGEQIVFRSTYDPLGGGDPAPWDVFGIQADGSGLQRLTADGNAGHPMLSGDGSSMIFWSDSDPVGGNACELPQMFIADSDGGNVLQLTSTPSPACNIWVDHPVLARDADLTVYQSGPELYSMPAGGGTATLIVDDGNSFRKHPRISGDGQWTAYHTETDEDGLNPAHFSQIFRARTDGSFRERLTADQSGASFFPDLSADGQRIVYESLGDPLGTNPDRNREIFLYEVASGTTTQLTTTASGGSSFPRISADGSSVWFRSSAPLSGSFASRDLYRTLIGSGTFQRVGGLPDPLHGDIGSTSFRDNLGLEVDADGDRAVFSGTVDATGTNPDRNPQLFFVDLSASPSIEVGVSAPTLVSWDVEPSPWRYDVIRGDVATLSAGGGTVDLGPVVCLEDESLDARTAGDEDVLQPTAGQVLFYLYRGAGPGGPGSWGAGSDGSPRQPTSGACPS